MTGRLTRTSSTTATRNYVKKEPAIISWYLLAGLETEGNNPTSLLLGFATLALLFAIPVGLSVITWKWLGGKEEREKEREGPADTPHG